MKVIFLDIDGVLTTNKQFYMNQDKFKKKNEWAGRIGVPYPFDPDCVNIFNNILTNTGAEIVLSSDWRNFFNTDHLSEIFEINGCVKSPIDVTSSKVHTFNYDKNRVIQIETYILEKNVEDYVIIDDLPLHLYLTTGKDRFIQTRLSEGLKQSNIYNKIMRVLTI